MYTKKINSPIILKHTVNIKNSKYNVKKNVDLRWCPKNNNCHKVLLPADTIRNQTLQAFRLIRAVLYISSFTKGGLF